MKKIIVTSLLMLFIFTLCYSQEKHNFDGVWLMEYETEISSRKDGKIVKKTVTIKSYKFINGNRFTVSAAENNGRIGYTHSGTCYLDGDYFLETIEFSTNLRRVGGTSRLASTTKDGKWIIKYGNTTEEWTKIDTKSFSK